MNNEIFKIGTLKEYKTSSESVNNYLKTLLNKRIFLIFKNNDLYITSSLNIKESFKDPYIVSVFNKVIKNIEKDTHIYIDSSNDEYKVVFPEVEKLGIGELENILQNEEISYYFKNLICVLWCKYGSELKNMYKTDAFLDKEEIDELRDIFYNNEIVYFNAKNGIK